ncbi:hypothetical protein LSTR_LSTR005748 [Laodelphax striatellus]|uniref:Centromere protein M n=1 Tax=Laodelphax striatellus TaxID=195883 RepID=A0A482XI01_LAOST|nr:hypothetical protein LSTR_LSTR005748 [Laodelphax striatellus]
MESNAELETPILKFGRRFDLNDNQHEKCSVLLVSSGRGAMSFLQRILAINREEFKTQFQINICESISDFLKLDVDGHFDYIVLLVNPIVDRWLDEVERNIALLDNEIRSRRLCLAIDTSNTIPADIIEPIQQLKKKYSPATIFGELANENEEDTEMMCRKILSLIKLTCLNKFGLPLVLQFPSFC